MVRISTRVATSPFQSNSLRGLFSCFIVSKISFSKYVLCLVQERNTSKSRWSETRLTSRTAKHKKESVPKKLHLNPQATSQNTTNLKSEELKSVPTLHPSWQASKVKKQQNKIVQFTGKHVRFDDSD